LKQLIEFKQVPLPGKPPNFGAVQEPIRLVIVVPKVLWFLGGSVGRYLFRNEGDF